MELPQSGTRTWLVVEDDNMLRILLTEMITMWNRTALTFRDGFQAMAWLDEVEAGEAMEPLPELALLDIRMPGPQGHEIGKRLRDICVTTHTPIVIMTAFHFNPEERDRINSMVRPDKLISKPLPWPDNLKALLEEVVSNSQQKAAREDKAEHDGKT